MFKTIFLAIFFILMLLAVEHCIAANYQFDGSMSREVVESYLSRGINMGNRWGETLAEKNDQYRMIKNIGAKLIIRAVMRWSNYSNIESHFSLAQTRASELHQVDPDIIVAAGIFEVVRPRSIPVPIPSWVFVEFVLPVEVRNFNQAAMLYDPPWGLDGGIAPDISRIETQMFFYYLARRYIDAGIEGIHFGQTYHICRNDSGEVNMLSVLTKIRNYARIHARRHFVLCDAYTRGAVNNGKLLFDYHTWPTRPKEVLTSPQEAILEMGFGDTIWGRSSGGTTPSGWYAAHLPYLAEIDNGASDCVHAGEPSGFPYVWNYDEISWFSHQTETYRNQWLQYAWNWIRQNDSNGYLQMQGAKPLYCDPYPEDGSGVYYANTVSAHFPNGFNQEGTIKSIWLGSTVVDTQVPAVPTNLTTTAVSSSQINLSWTASTDNVGATGYRLDGFSALS